VVELELYHVVIESEQLKKGDELPFSGKEYFTCEYKKHKRRMTQIGVVVENATRVVVTQFERVVARLTLDKKSGVWYHKQEKWFENNFRQKTDGIFGINAGGSFTVVAYDKNDIVIDRVIVNITPGTMSLEEYQQMQKDVLRLFELFSYDLTKINQNEDIFLRRVQLPLFPQHQFEELLDQFIESFNEIIKMPEHDLMQVEKKVSIQQVKKWTPSMIIENEIKQNGKVRAIINEKIIDIKEHRMIRFMVEEFQQRIDMELFAEQNHFDTLLNELEQLEDAIRKETSYLARSFRKLTEIIQSDCEKLKKRIYQWLNMKQKVNKVFEQPLLQCDSQTVEETHLFRMHPLYSEVYSLYDEYEKLSPVQEDTFRQFIQSILKSPTLYEVWILLKIIQQLSHWDKTIPYQFIKDLKSENYVDATSIRGYRKKFNLEERSFEVDLYYDYTFSETGYRPDFVIGFFNRAEEKWYMHTLDAKYKSYSRMKKGKQKILKDLKDSGVKYLNELFSNQPNILLKSATLVHPDVNLVNWNVKNSELNPLGLQHRLAHFSFTPKNNKNLEIYFKRMLHECSHLKTCCPSCGKKIKAEKDELKEFANKKGYKTTYICKDCNVVWVANFCSSCFYYGRGMNTIEKENKVFRLARPLYKYSHNNYNLQVDDKWDVHCPTCNKTIEHWKDYRIKEDIFQGSIILGEN